MNKIFPSYTSSPCPLPSHVIPPTGSPENTETFDYAYESGRAYKKGTLADDILAEQTKLDAADLVIFQFPFSWSSVPAMLKGWFERVFTNEYAFNTSGNMHMMYDNGNFKVSRKHLKLIYSYYLAENHYFGWAYYTKDISLALVYM